MSSKFIILGLTTLILIGGIFYFNRSNNITDTVAASSYPWIEVTNAKVFVSTKAGVETELKSGDEVKPGSTIRSDASGEATIHLPDGSLLRLDKNSTLTIKEINFNEEDETLVVKAKLLSGRVW